MTSNGDHGQLNWNGGRREVSYCQDWLSVIEATLQIESMTAEGHDSDLIHALELAKQALERTISS